MKAGLTGGLAIENGIEAAHATDLCGASARNDGVFCCSGMCNASTLTLGIVRARLAAVPGGPNASLHGSENALNGTALRFTVRTLLGREPNIPRDRQVRAARCDE